MSHVEQQNLTMRMQMRRLTRLSNGFSQKWEDLEAMMAMYFTLRKLLPCSEDPGVTPARASGLVDRAWSLLKLLAR
jgi:hypothetical protein